jgi:hypothetical protein
MSSRASSVIGWICAGLVSAFTVFSSVMAFLYSADPAAIAMGERLGIIGMEQRLAIVKLVIVALYLFPRTSVVGFVLMVGYYGGVLATNMTHAFTLPEYAPVILVFVLLTIDAWFRKPELTDRLMGKKS